MQTITVGLVDVTRSIDPQFLAAAAAALNIQVTRDLPHFWPVTATVAYLPDPHRVPQGVWPVQIVRSLPPGEGGFHMTKRNHQPYAKVIATPGSDEWTVDYELTELEPRRASNLYAMCQKRRRKVLDDRGEDEIGVAANAYIRQLREVARQGRDHRKKEDQLDAENGIVVFNDPAK